MRKQICICDKCGKEIGLQSKMPAPYIQIRLLAPGNRDTVLDLCDDCNAELGRFLFKDNPDAQRDWERCIGWQTEDLIRQIKESVAEFDAVYKGEEYDIYCTADIYSQIVALRRAWTLPPNIVEIHRIPLATMIPAGTVLLCLHNKGPVSTVFEQSGAQYV